MHLLLHASSLHAFYLKLPEKVIPPSELKEVAACTHVVIAVKVASEVERVLVSNSSALTDIAEKTWTSWLTLRL